MGASRMEILIWRRREREPAKGNDGESVNQMDEKIRKGKAYAPETASSEQMFSAFHCITENYLKRYHEPC